MNKLQAFLKNLVTFLIIFIVINFIFTSFFGKPGEEEATLGNSVILETTDDKFSRLETVTLELTNGTEKSISVENNCPNQPLTVLRYEQNEWVQKTATTTLECASQEPIILESGEKTLITYENWNQALFSEMGRFQIEFETQINGQVKTISSNEFTVVKEGIFRQLWHGLFYRPIYNLLAAIISFLPGHKLGWGIIILTIIIRTILLAPSQKSIRAQKKMQEIQPRLDKIKEKHKGDQQKIAMETMAIWKEAKISPMSSCLPLLLQFPFLIALFYVVRDIINPDNAFMLYTQYNNFSLAEVDPIFFGLNLIKKNAYLLPLIVGSLQFIQMRMTLTKQKKKNPKKKQNMAAEMQKATNIMGYVMPIMIAVFTATLPAGVGIYWGTSTSYGIVQQLFIRKSKDNNNNDGVKVKVIS